MIFHYGDKYQDFGIFLLRLGIGAMFIYHGLPKMLGGAAAWGKLGAAMSFLGINFAQPFFGFMSAITEFGGGILLVLGLFLRPVAVLLTFNMIVAVLMLVGSGQGFAKASEAIEVGMVFLSLIFIGPGRYSIDAKLFGDKAKRYSRS